MKRALLFSPLLCVFVSVSLLAQASVTLSPSSYNFGSTPVGTGTAWVTFTLSNSGSSAVSISNVTVSGPFVVSSNCGSSVAANGSCPIYVYFYPTAAGAASGTLTVTDNATNSPQTSSLSGTGGSGGSCTTTPSAPTGLAASGTTRSGRLSCNAALSLPRTSFAKALAGTRKAFRAGLQSAPSSETPPPVTRQWT